MILECYGIIFAPGGGYLDKVSDLFDDLLGGYYYLKISRAEIRRQIGIFRIRQKSLIK